MGIYRDRILDILTKKFKEDKNFESFVFTDLNDHPDVGWKKPYTSDTIIGFSYTSKIDGENASMNYGSEFTLDFEKMRCIEKSYNKSLSQAFFKKLDREFEHELTIAMLKYYVIEIEYDLDYEFIKFDKFRIKYISDLHEIYEKTKNEMFLSQKVKDMFLF